jgi:polyphenol oxidase
MSVPMETITTDSELERAGFLWRESVEGVRAFVCAPLEREGFSNAFSTRAGGVSPFPEADLNLAGFDDDTSENIRENRRRFLSLLDGGDWTLATCWQVHGTDVRIVSATSDAQNNDVRCDILTTDAANILLGVKTADCVPVLLGDARRGVCAAVHAGWRGTLASIVARALETMRAEFGTEARDVRAAVGPAARACCYEVGPEVVAAFREKFPRADSFFKHTRDGHALADIQEANRQQLIAAGVEAHRIHTLPLCTICRPELFFSYRRDKKLYGRTGRLLSVIGRR